MTFPVQIEHHSHAIVAHLHALPRPGDRITCSFPTAGIPTLFLVVKLVYFHQPAASEIDGKECREPFRIAVTTEGDPDHREHNESVFQRLAADKG